MPTKSLLRKPMVCTSRFLLLLAALLFSSHFALAQTITVTGTVKAQDDGLTLPGVSIFVKGTTTGTTTDMNGTYTLKGLSPKTVLVYSFLGYISQEVIVADQRNIDVVLVSDIKKLEEVVVTALGVKRQKREIGYSTEKVNTEEIVRSGAPNVLSAIVGKSAGVQVSLGDGVEGGTTRITIRGNNNLTGNNQPLIVIDGVPIDNKGGIDGIGRGVDWGNGVSDINPYDIEDYSILKGGPASALYGSRGANGVILITTKRGKKQQGLGVTYNYDYKVTNPYRFRDVQNKYGHGGPIAFTEPTFPTDENGTLLYPGIYSNEQLVLNQQGETSTSTAEFGYYGSAVSWGPEMKGQLIKWWDGEMRSYSPQPDNLKLGVQNGFTKRHHVAASGGSDKGSIRFSFTREDMSPIIDNSNSDRTTLNVGANMKISEKLRADVSLTYVRFNRLNSPIIGEDGNSINKGLLYSWPRSYKGLDKENYQLADGSRNPNDGYPFYYVDKYIWWNTYMNNSNLQRDKYTGSVGLSYEITPWLTYTLKGGRDYSIEHFETRNSPIDVIGLDGGSYAASLSRSYDDNFETMLTAQQKKVFGSALNLRFSIGANRWENNYYAIDGRSGKWYYPNMYTFFNYTATTYYTDANGNIVVQKMGDGATLAAGEALSRRRTNSAFSFLNLDYKDYLFVEITGRNDWSSTLPSNANSYFYPSISTSFIASEAFGIQQKLPWLNFVKLRGGVAQTASDTDPYQTAFYYTTSMFGGQQTSQFPSTIPPFQLKPQRVNSYEVGLNLGFLENRIDFDFTYYYKYSFDQILNLPIPTSAGASSIMINEGILSNRGFEIVVNAVPLKTKDMLLKTGLNISFNRNYIVSLGDYSDQILLADIWGLNGPAISLREGDEYGTIVGYDYVYNEEGKRVLNDDGTKYKITDSRVPIGNASPDFVGGFNTSFTYKNFTLNAQVDTKWGGDIYCGSYVIGLQTGQSPETLLERDGGGLPYTDPEGNVRNVGVILDGVYEDGTPNTKVVHYYYKYMPNAGGWGKFVSTPGIVENTWVKLREVSISYALPERFARKLRFFQSLTLTLAGRDLMYLYTTLPDNINPEGIIGSGNAQGFEWGAYPGTRSFTFSLNATF